MSETIRYIRNKESITPAGGNSPIENSSPSKRHRLNTSTGVSEAHSSANENANEIIQSDVVNAFTVLKSDETIVDSLAGLTVASMVEMWYKRELNIDRNLSMAVPDRTTRDKVKQVMLFINSYVVQENEKMSLSQRNSHNISVREEHEQRRSIMLLTQGISERNFNKLREFEKQHLGKGKTSRQPNVASVYDRLVALKSYLTEPPEEQSTRIDDFFHKLG